MSSLALSVHIDTHVIFKNGSDSKEFLTNIRRMQKVGWFWDGKVWNLKTVDTEVKAAVMTSISCPRAAKRSPRLDLTRT